MRPAELQVHERLGNAKVAELWMLGALRVPRFGPCDVHRRASSTVPPVWFLGESRSCTSSTGPPRQGAGRWEAEAEPAAQRPARQHQGRCDQHLLAVERGLGRGLEPCCALLQELWATRVEEIEAKKRGYVAAVAEGSPCLAAVLLRLGWGQQLRLPG